MTKKVNRNDPCTCGSGKKYKKCCGKPGMGRHTATVLNPSTISSALMGRISQAGAAFSADRKIDVMSKGVTVGRVTPGNPIESTQEKKAGEQEPSSTPETEDTTQEKKSEETQEND